MTEPFELPVVYKNESLLLQAELQSWGYSHRIIVMVNGQSVIFEPDEERNYRAVVATGQPGIDHALLACIVDALKSAFK